MMSSLYPIIFLLIFSSCNENGKNFNVENFINESELKVSNTESCNSTVTKNFTFSYDDFSSEGNEGEIVFKNDTLSRILFSFATSQTIVEQIYFFNNNQLENVKVITNYICLDKNSYSLSDTLILTKKEFIEQNDYNRALYDRLLKTASNPDSTDL